MSLDIAEFLAFGACCFKLDDEMRICFRALHPSACAFGFLAFALKYQWARLEMICVVRETQLR